MYVAVGAHKGGFGIVNYNPRRTYCPLVPKQYTYSATKCSPQAGSYGIKLENIDFFLSKSPFFKSINSKYP